MPHFFYPLVIANLFLSGLQTLFQQGEPTATPVPISLSMPLPGQALQGSIPIILNAGGQEFQSLEISFAYQNDPTGTWFLIYENTQGVSSGELAQWDTTTLTDGEYQLRVQLSSQDGSQTSLQVPNLRVRNYTAIETDTPVPTETPPPGDTPMPIGTPTGTPTDTPTPTITPIPATSTPLPPNPAQLTPQDITISLGKGALAALATLGFIALYTAIKNAFKN